MSKTVSSPDIAILDFSVMLDMSLADPSISVTNLSTGLVPANLKWVFKVLSPSGTPIHEGSFDAPDIDGTAFSTFNFSGEIPMPFGQLEFSKNSSYSVKVSVQDSDDNVFELSKAASICKPVGNNGKNNFGLADIAIESKCSLGKLYITDQTDLIYKGITGTKVSTEGSLSYPKNESGVAPADVAFTLMPVLLPIQTGGNGYGLYVAHIYQYDLGDYFYVKVRYSFNNKSFPVWCNYDLCPLICEFDKLMVLVDKECDDQLKAGHQKKLALINAKLMKCVIGILQPLCGFDVPKLIEEIKEIGGFTCDCCRPQGISTVGAVTDANISLSVNKLGGDAEMSWTANGDGSFTLNYSDYTYTFSICEDSGSEAFEYKSTTVGYVKDTCLKVNIVTLATEIFTEAQNNQTIINMINSIVNQTQLNCSGIDPKGIYAATCNYTVQLPTGTPGDFVVNVVINGVERTAPDGLLLIQDANIQSWLNTLSLGTFTAVYNVGTNLLTISSTGNTNSVSSIKVEGSASRPRIVSFSNTCGNICTILQNIINYLFSLNMFQVQLGQKINVCSLDGNGQIVATSYEATDSAWNLAAGMAAAICSLADQIGRRGVNATNLKAQFAEFTGGVPVAGDYFLMSKNGILTKIPLEKAALSIFSLLSSDVDVKNKYCEGSLCSSVANCSPVNDLAVSPGDTSAEATWTGVVGAVGYRWSLDGLNYYLVVGTSKTLVGLTAATSYTLRVYPVFNNGDGTDCEVTLAFNTTGLGASCAEPAGFTPSNITGDSATLTWDAVTGASGYQYRLNGASWVNVGLVLTVDIAGLTASTEYNAELRALVGGSPCTEVATETFSTITNGVILSNNFADDEAGFVVTRLTVNTLNVYDGGGVESGDTSTVLVPVIATSYTYGARVVTDIGAVDTAAALRHYRGVSMLHEKTFTALAAGVATDVQFDTAFVAQAGDVFVLELETLP